MWLDRYQSLVGLISLLVLVAVQPLFAARPGQPAANCDLPVFSELDTVQRLAGDGAGPYEHGLDGARSVFCDDNLILRLDHFDAATARLAKIDLTSPAEAGLPSYGISLNSSLSMNVRGQIAAMDVGEVRAVEALFTFKRDADGRTYRVNFSGSNGTDLVQVERVSGTQWVVQAPDGSKARLWDATKPKAVLIGLYSMDFHLTITTP